MGRTQLSCQGRQHCQNVLEGKETGPVRDYAMYFNCNTSLVDTFKELYGDLFNFEGNRAIVFNETDELVVNELKHCISLALTYHRVKRLPLLGANSGTLSGRR